MDAFEIASKFFDSGKQRNDLELAILQHSEALMLERNNLRRVLDATHGLISEGALSGFNALDGTWADRLFQNQGAIRAALNPK